MKNVCVVCEYGWIIKGGLATEKPDRMMLTNASVVRKWANGKGIGGIAKKANAKEYMLDPIGDVEIMRGKVIFVIPCEW